MNRLILSLVAALAVACTDEKPENDSISVIPWPSHVQAEEGHFSLWKGTVVHLEEDSEIQRTVGFLNERLSKVSGYTLKTKPMDLTETEGIFFLNTGLKTEAYSLRIESGRIVIEYGDGAGAFYGLQTLFQLFPQEIFSSEKSGRKRWDIPCCVIEDSPRFSYRGMHLDCCHTS